MICMQYWTSHHIYFPTTGWLWLRSSFVSVVCEILWWWPSNYINAGLRFFCVRLSQGGLFDLFSYFASTVWFYVSFVSLWHEVALLNIPAESPPSPSPLTRIFTIIHQIIWWHNLVSPGDKVFKFYLGNNSKWFNSQKMCFHLIYFAYMTWSWLITITANFFLRISKLLNFSKLSR